MKKISITAKSKTDAQSRVDQIRSFQSELELIENEEIVSLDEDQKFSIAKYHKNVINQLSIVFDIDSNKREKQFSLGMKIASFLGAVGLASSIFFFFYQFWGGYSTISQVLILVTAPIICLAATMYVAHRESTGYFSKVFGLVTFACFVLNLVMFGQIFNITPSENAFLVWAGLAFLLAYASDARLLLVAGLISISCFISARMGTWCGCYWLDFGEHPENFFPAAIILFLVPTFISHKKFSGFDSTYRIFSMLLFFITILILSNWGAGSYIGFYNEAIENLYQIAGFVFSAGAICLGLRKNWRAVTNIGNVFFVIFLYTKFYDWWWDWMPKYLFFLIIGLTAILALLIFKKLRNSTNNNIKVVL